MGGAQQQNLSEALPEGVKARIGGGRHRTRVYIPGVRHDEGFGGERLDRRSRSFLQKARKKARKSGFIGRVEESCHIRRSDPVH
jgi:hypothetical protein